MKTIRMLLTTKRMTHIMLDMHLEGGSAEEG